MNRTGIDPLAVASIIDKYEPESYVKYNVELSTLMSRLRLSPAEADILKVLLSEYKGDPEKFCSKSHRHHIAALRRKLRPIVGHERIILSLGLGFYLITDEVKTVIRTWVEREPGQ